MKTKLFTLLLAVAASVGTMFAEKVQIGDLYYNLNETDQTAEVTYELGGANNYLGLTTVHIPASVTYSGTTYRITSIGSGAFQFGNSLTSVTIPNSVTSIGRAAFRDCSSLTSVTIPNSVTSIGNYAFNGCSSLTSVTIPNSVTSIGDYAFNGCSSLTSVTIPNSVTSIGDYAFRDCSSLTSVTIPNSVTSIGDEAFGGVNNIIYSGTAIGSPWGAKCVNGYVDGYLVYSDDTKTTLLGCSAAATGTIVIPNSVTSIGYGAFNECSSLTSITIPNSVTSIGDYAFADCISLTSVTIPNSVTSIGETAFYGCSSLTSVTIPNSVTSIGENAFHNCSGLTSINIPNSVTSIGNYTFKRCRSLTSVTIPNSVTSIGYEAFWGCISLTSVTIPNSVTSIGYGAFNECSSLTAIYVPCGELEKFKQMLNNDSRINDHAPLPYTITINAINGNVTYPQTMCDDMQLNATPNYGYHFVKWSDGNTDNPRMIELTQDTTFTAEFAYDRVGQCGKDMALVWSYDPTNKVLTIGNAGEFTENIQFGAEAPAEMEELVIGNNVTAIGENAFAGISTLKKVTIGESVKTIHNNAFYNCVNLETIFNYRPTPTNAYSTAFDGVDKFECKLYVLPNSIDMYKNASVWRDFYYTYAIGAEETTVTTNDVKVEPQDNAATVTWPTSENAASYTIQITKDGVVFCTLIFNANGQLTGIAFAPGRDGQSMAPAAVMTANGLQFTVTGLDSNTQYGYSLTAKDANEQSIATYSGSFTTTSEGIATGVDNTAVESEITKILRNGEVLILRGGKTYTIQGVEVK